MKFNSLNYISLGDGIPVVFQHGLGGQLDNAYQVMKDIEGIRLICMDCRGHGDSLVNDKKPSFNLYSDDIIRLLDHLAIDNAIAGGISMGSGVAINLAVRYPDRVGALILVRPAWLDKSCPFNLDILLKASDFVDKENGKNLFAETRDFRSFQNAAPNAAISVLGQFEREQVQYTSLVLNSMINDRPVNKLDRLCKVDKPCLILASDNDPLHPYSFASELHNYLPKSKLIRVVSKYFNPELHQHEIRNRITEFLSSYLHK